MQPAEAPFTSTPPKQVLHWQAALLWLSLGFLTIIVLTWCDTLFNLMHHLFGTAYQDENLDQALIATGVIVLLWLFSSYKVYRIVSRLSYLENFLHVCAWCRKIEHKQEWYSLEELFTKQTGGQTSHGMCPECAKKFREAARQDLPPRGPA